MPLRQRRRGACMPSHLDAECTKIGSGFLDLQSGFSLCLTFLTTVKLAGASASVFSPFSVCVGPPPTAQGDRPAFPPLGRLTAIFFKTSSPISDRIKVAGKLFPMRLKPIIHAFPNRRLPLDQSMPATEDKKLGKISKKEGRVTVATLSTDLKIYARKRWPLDKDSRRKERLADLLNMTVRRVRSLWGNEVTARPSGEEIERIEALIGVDDEMEEANRNAFADLQERLARLEAIILARETEQDHGHVARTEQGPYGRRRTDVAHPPSIMQSR